MSTTSLDDLLVQKPNKEVEARIKRILAASTETIPKKKEDAKP